MASANFMVSAISPKRRLEALNQGTPAARGQARDLARILQRGGQRLVDEQRLMRGDHGARLLQVHAAVHAFEQHGIHVAAQLRECSA